MRITRRIAADAGGVLAPGFTAGTAQAAAAMTMSTLPDSAQLVQKLYVSVAVTIACDPGGVGWFGGAAGQGPQAIRLL